MYQKEVEKVLKELESSYKGLSAQEAVNRLSRFGKNELKKVKKVSIAKLVLEQFIDPLVLILLAAVVISFVIGAKKDAVAIFAIVILNAIIGFSQEYKAEKEIELLKKLSSQKAIVIREGKKQEIDAKNIVPGDIIIIQPGDKIPADSRLIEVNNLKIDESSLTGESTTVEKIISMLHNEAQVADQKNMVFSGTIAKEGTAKAVVTAIGMQTEIGKIAHLVQETVEAETPLQKNLKKLGKALAAIILSLALVIFAAGIIMKINTYDMFLTSLSLAISAIPEGLPVIMTLALALSVQVMYKRKALIRKLKAVETLGSITVIASDKTGTLTKNEMTVTELFVDSKEILVTGKGYETKGKFLHNNKEINPSALKTLLEIGSSCNNAQLPKLGDPTELALLVSAAKANIGPKERIAETPFNAVEKYMTTTHLIGNKKITYIKGAPEKLLEMSDYLLVNNAVKKISSEDKKEILEQNKKMASRALRVLAMAYKQDNKTVFAGLQGMIDPPRKEVKRAIELCRKAGIKVYMITGDHINTAVAIGSQLSIPQDAIEGKELDKLSGEQLRKIVKEKFIFARVSPEHKSRILAALQANKEIVAMTGDGVNDAPALKKADIGIAMNIKGTDIARESSDMILIDDNFSSIVKAIKEGRIVYDNIKKFLKYLLSVNFSELFVVLAALFAKLPIPFIPLQILWINLATDALPALALSKEKGDETIMHHPPRDPKEHILKGMQSYILIGGLLAFIAMLILFLFEYLTTNNVDKARTIAVTTSVMFQMFFVFSCRSDRSLKEVGLFSNKYLIGAVLLTVILQILIIYTPISSVFAFTPLSIKDWILIIAVSSIGFIFFEVKKLINGGSKR
ncbi:calcium-translocating P-type ATPase, PMCA-type [Candidatus Woesearchaeota archaeon]|nr:calcium-translocating P-type ATPase, PMCA-type [Candidatus Woesearchaeota archaeon]